MKQALKTVLVILAVILTFHAFLSFSACSSGQSSIPSDSIPTVHPEDEWTGTIWLEDADDHLIIHSPYGEDNLRYIYVEDITYTRALGDEGVLKDGIQNDRVSSGIFENEDTTYRLHVYNGYNHYLMLTCNGELYVFNLESRDELLEWKDLITQRMFE